MDKRVDSVDTDSPRIGRRRLAVSVVTYNSSFELLAFTFSSLDGAVQRLQDKHPEFEVDVLLVDNSTNHVYRTVLFEHVYPWSECERFHSFRHWHPGSNLGYGCGHNSAIFKLESDFHLILNPDVEMDADALLQAVDYLDANPGVSMIAPSAHNQYGEREFLCKRYPSVLTLTLRGFAPAVVRHLFDNYLARYEMRDILHSDEAFGNVSIASGCFMFTRTDHLKAVGGFSEVFFLYFEDFDLSLRLSHFGKVVYLPAVKIIHHGGYSAKKGLNHIRLFIKSAAKFFHKNGWRLV